MALKNLNIIKTTKTPTLSNSVKQNEKYRETTKYNTKVEKYQKATNNRFKVIMFKMASKHSIKVKKVDNIQKEMEGIASKSNNRVI